MTGAIVLSTAVSVSVSVSGCGDGGDAEPRAPLGRVVLRGGPAPALAALPDGGLLVGFLATGRIWRVPAHGPPRRAFPALRVSTAGHLAPAPEGRLVIGIGDRQTGRPVGRLLSLDPAGPATQVPRTLSTGWNNPFAFTFTPDGRLWVADNAPGKAPERLARGDSGGMPATVTVLDRRPAASGLAALGSRSLALCGVVSGTLDRYALEGGRWRRSGTLARGCRYGVVALADGRLAFSTDDGVRTVRP